MMINVYYIYKREFCFEVIRMLFPISGGAFEGVEDQVSPFGYGRGEGVDAGHGDPEWICSKEKPNYDRIFQSLNPIDGKVTGAGTNMQILKYPEPRGTVLLDRTLQIMHSATQNCTLLSELCIHLHHTNSDDPNFGKIVDALTVANETCSAVARCLVGARGREDDDMSFREPVVESPSVSRCHSNEDDTPFDTSDDTASDTSADAAPSRKPPAREPTANTQSILNPLRLIRTVFGVFEAIVVATVTVVLFMISSQLLFMLLAKAITGETYFEFSVEKTPNTWLEKAKSLTFGAEDEIVKLEHVAGLLQPRTVASLARYVAQRLGPDD